MAPQCVDELGALPNQQVSRSEDHTGGLLFFRLYRNEAHAQSPRRLANRFCIDRIVLVPLHKRFDVGGRDKSHLMAELCQLARPVMRPAACFHSNEASWLSSEEVEQLSAGQFATEQSLTAFIGATLLRDWDSKALETFRKMVLPVRIELTTSALPRMRSTTELRQHGQFGLADVFGTPMQAGL